MGVKFDPLLGALRTTDASGTGDMVLASIQTVTGAKTFSDSTLLLAGSSSGSTTLKATAAASGVLTLPAATDTLVGRATTDTLTNKTLTSPVINTPTGIVKADVGLGSVDNTSDATKNSATATLTNKSLTSPTITGTVAATAATINGQWFGAGLTNAGTASYEAAANGALQGMRIQGAASTDVSFSTYVSGDAQLRFLFAPSGQMDWGSGAAVTDTHLNRSGVSELSLTGRFKTTLGIPPRISTITSSATPAINTDNVDQFNITALAAAITSMTSSLTGTPVDGQKLLIRFKDNGTARAITWGASFTSSGVATLLTTTVVSKTHMVGLIYDSVVAKWVCQAVDATGY